jgi:hypothetical protein
MNNRLQKVIRFRLLFSKREFKPGHHGAADFFSPELVNNSRLHVIVVVLKIES